MNPPDFSPTCPVDGIPSVNPRSQVAVEEQALSIKAYQLHLEALKIRPASRTTEWMDNVTARAPYRCLPLLMSMQSGWELLCPVTFSAVWNGAHDECAIHLEGEDGKPPKCARSHFSQGLLTFELGWLFRTTPGHNLWVKGPTNRPKDAIQPLEGLVETDWLPFTFTMNWIFTRPDVVVTFQAGEPIGMILPYPRGYVENFSPTCRRTFDDPQLQQDYLAWTGRRRQYNADLNNPDSEASHQKWQKDYFLGLNLRGETVESHQTKLPVKEFTWEVE